MAGAQSTLSTCDCLAFHVLRRCCCNRHWHAVLKKSGILCLIDLDRGIPHNIEISVNKTQLLPSKSLKRTDLEFANVICVFNGVVVVQIFCQDASHVVFCDFVTGKFLADYKIPYGSQSRPCLFECFLSPDLTHAVMKVSMSYAMSYCPENSHNAVRLIKIDHQNKTCVTLQEFDDNIHTYTCIAFSPVHKHSQLVIGTASSFSEVTPAVDMTDTSAWQLVPYRPREQNYVVNQYHFDQNKVRLMSSKTVSLVPDHDMEIRMTNEGQFLLISTTNSHSSLMMTCRYGERTVLVLHAETFQRLAVFSHVCVSGACNLAFMLQDYGSLGDCLGSKCVLQYLLYKTGDIVIVPNLKEMCRKVIVNQIWPEDVFTLPLPKPMKKYLMFYPCLD